MLEIEKNSKLAISYFQIEETSSNDNNNQQVAKFDTLLLQLSRVYFFQEKLLPQNWKKETRPI